ncbi:DUF932 domain-containing protein [bacterium]|nr:DUF932 domain-containing protein [bacterium]
MKTKIHYTNSLADLMSVAPAIANETIHESCSERYSLVSTRRIAETMIRDGWTLMGGKQGGTRKEGMRNFTRHSVLLSRPDLEDGDLGVKPYIQFLNAHAGRGSAQARIGLYRGACANEIMFDAMLEVKCRTRHTGNAEEGILHAISLVAAKMPETLRQARDWSKFSTKMDERVELAEAGLAARFGESRSKWAVDAEAVLSNWRRAEDRNYDLWTTLNVVQENILRPFRKGAINEETGKRIPFRSVSAIDTLARVNVALVKKAEEIVGLVS